MEEVKYSKKGDKVKVEKCPHCNERLVVDLGGGDSEVFVCKNCSFKIKKKN